jgi:hypothetical protein
MNARRCEKHGPPAVLPIEASPGPDLGRGTDLVDMPPPATRGIDKMSKIVSDDGLDILFRAEGTATKSNFLCNLGHGDASKLFLRSPRPRFEEACEVV